MEPTTLTADFGGTRIKLGLLRGDHVLAQTAVDAQAKSGLSVRLPQIATVFRDLCAQTSVDPATLTGIGMAFPSLIDPKTRRIVSTNDKYPDATTIDLVDWARRTFALPVAIENDANAALAGEWRFGAGRGTQSCVMMTLGTGVGTSAVIDGVPLRGQHGQAGCLGGHMVINTFGRVCVCRGVGCVETEASSWALPAIARDHPGFAGSRLATASKIDFSSVFTLAAEGDKCAVELRDRCINVWASAAINLVHAYDPEIVILGGGIMNSPEPIVSGIQKHLDEHAWVGWGRVRVIPGTLGDSAALLGLGYLAVRQAGLEAESQKT